MIGSCRNKGLLGLKERVFFRRIPGKMLPLPHKTNKTMDTLFQKHRKGITFACNLLFWIIACYFFVRSSVLRPICNMHIYKEFVCIGLIALVVLVTRFLTIPKLFSTGRYGWFWLASVSLLITATVVEISLVKPDIQDKMFFNHVQSAYLPYYYGMIFLRDSCFFAWFLVFRLYTLQKDTFRAKQRASIMEHMSVQFSTPDHKEISVPLDIIIYIQEVDHTTQVHCTEDHVITVSEPLSYCKEMIPATLWAPDGSEKMVFHQHLSEFLQTQNKPEVREIKYITLLSERQFRIFEIIRQNSGCNATFIHDSFRGKVTIRTIERDLATMRNKEVVAHVGSNKDGGYEVCTLNVVSAE